MLSLFQKNLEIHKLCTKEDAVLLAVSGGLDSMTMLNLFHLSGYTLGVAHCNFQLRGKASDEDELLVQTVCGKLGIPFYSTRFDTAHYAGHKKLSIQMAARELRYAWLADVRKREKYRYIATAHHVGDNVETVLINLIRGSGFMGLQGIPPKAGNVIRPLFYFSREELEGYARKNAVVWREDSSNRTEKYMRNKIRMHVLPVLKQLNPSLEDTFLRNRERLAGAAELFSLGKDRLKEKFYIASGGDIKIARTIVTDIQYPVPVLWEMIKEYGFNYDHCCDIVALCRHGGGVGKLFLSHTHRLVIDRDSFWIGDARYLWKTLVLDRESKEAFLGPWRLGVAHSSEPGFGIDPSIAHLDADRIRWPLTWRKWSPGDRFYPLGMSHRKKVSDFFIDEKLSPFDKERATVVESGHEIIWVAGYRIDNRFKVTRQTSRVLALSLTCRFFMIFFFFFARIDKLAFHLI